MTQEQIELIDKAEYYEKLGYVIDTTHAFIGYECAIWEIHNDHDIKINIENNDPNSKFKIGSTFKTRWDALKAAINYLNETLKI